MSFAVPIGGSSLRRHTIHNDACRFIPSRSAMEKAESYQTYSISLGVTPYSQELTKHFFPNYSPRTLLTRNPNQFTPAVEKIAWDLPQKSIRMLATPELNNNFYCNNLDWGNDFLGINLAKVSYAYNFVQKTFFKCADHTNTLSSIKWHPINGFLAYGDIKSAVNLIDLKELKKWNVISNIDGSPIYSIDWRSSYEMTLGTGKNIFHFDSRSRNLAWSTNLGTSNHSVCALKWNQNKQLLATGCNDNHVRIFDISRGGDKCVYDYTHQAVVKALEWNPERHSLLLSGGGATDRVVKLFDTVRGERLSQADLQTQICSIVWLDQNYFVAGLGNLTSQNIEYWQVDSTFEALKKVGDAAHQQGRILNLAKDPKSFIFSSLSNDETLCFWEPKKVEKIQLRSIRRSSLTPPVIR